MGKKEKFTPKFLKKRKNNWGPPSVVAALATCLIVSLFYWDQNNALSSLIAGSSQLVFEKEEYWRLFTSVFAHADLEHYLSNMLMLGFLTYFVTSFYGPLAAALAFVAGAFINLGTLAWMEGETLLVGASGVVYYLWGFWLTLYLCIQKSVSVIGRLLRVGAIFLVLLIPTTYSPSTSYFAHYFGFVVGVFAAAFFYLLHPRRASRAEIEAALSEETRKHKPSAHPQPWEKDFDWGEGSYPESEPENEPATEREQ